MLPDLVRTGLNPRISPLSLFPAAHRSCHGFSDYLRRILHSPTLECKIIPGYLTILQHSPRFTESHI
jgi:hypothetical protein